MTFYSLVQRDFRSAGVANPGKFWRIAKARFDACLAARSRRQTEKLLARLDRSILEDLGVPHDGVSPSAGALDRYPHVITVETRRI